MEDLGYAGWLENEENAIVLSGYFPRLIFINESYDWEYLVDDMYDEDTSDKSPAMALMM